MNKSLVRFVSGRILMMLGALMLLPLLVSFYYHEPLQLKMGFGASILITEILGLALSFKRPASGRFHAREGLVICSLIWLLMSFLGALPLFFSGEVPHLADAFFEIASGFTTTGASVIPSVEDLHRSLLFWRSFTHLIGGMGVLVFALALLPQSDADDVFIMKAEVPGPAFGKLTSSLRTTARILYAIYLVMTGVLIVVLLLCGMPLFDAVCHAFGAAGTGGFGIKNDSVASYPTSVQLVLSVAMLLFGINFNLYYLLLLRKVRAFFKDEELKWYLMIVVIATGLICLSIYPLYRNRLIMLRDAFFTVSSIITTTGYSTADFAQWPAFAHAVLLLLMFFGAMSGSTAGGLKISRVMLYCKAAVAELRRQREPGRVAPVILNQKPLSLQVQRSLFGYFTIYAAVFSFFLLIVSFDSPDFTTAFSAVAATFNNIGPGMEAVGPTANYAQYHPLIKVVFSLVMICGRLEIWPILILFSLKTWKKA